MKYRTLIEIVCDASDKEEATNIAGDYLKGDIDFGVTMKSETVPLVSHRIRKYSAAVIFIFIVASTLLLKVSPVSVAFSTKAPCYQNFENAFTILPALKTRYRPDFKEEWEKKKDEAVLDYLKK